MFELLFAIVFIVIILTFAFVLISNILTWTKNSTSPRLTVPAVVRTKRTQVGRTHGANNIAHHYTRYFVTFEFESGDRLELKVDGSEYGMLAEGDCGMLSFQGTRYLGFTRDRTQSLTNSN